ncbi:MAG: HepT-like ribonuclease domain-containing protein [Thermomicrobiales bacterium]
MRSRSRRWLRDAAAAGAYIQTKVAGRTIDDYATDEDLRSIVERKFEILGEAIVRVRDNDPATVARLTGFREFINLADILAHDFDDITPVRVWAVAEDSLPTLLAEIAGLMAEEEAGE